MKVTVNDTTLIDIANAIREKGYSEDVFYPAEMGDAIRNLPSGGSSDGPTDEELVYTGDCAYKFKNDTWVIKHYGDRITTKDITSAVYMFQQATISHIPFDINFIPLATASHELSNMFYKTNIEYVPKLNRCRPSKLSGVFGNCAYLREIPEDFESWFDWGVIDGATSMYTGDMGGIFRGCESLRTIPMNIYTHGNPNPTYTYTIFNSTFDSCSSLDEVIDLPNPHSTANFTNNIFITMVHNCKRLKNFTFALNDGQPYKVRWKNQTIELHTIGFDTVGTNNIPSSYINSSQILKLNNGITADKYVYDDATYQALKYDPDWFTNFLAYSRYNHDSAVATINSLPDTSEYLASAGGTNIIKFTGSAGSSTDGGAINTLTEEEIAVATSKGWTVTLV